MARHVAKSLAVTLVAAAALVTADDARSADREDRRGRDRLDLEAGRAIARHTTEARYLTSWVDHVPEHRRVPSPRDFLGHVVGAPDHLTPPEQIHAYFRELDRTSNNVEVLEFGKSHGGRDNIAVAVGSRRNLRKLDDIAAAHAALADPRTLDESAARELAEDTPALYWITAGLHSPETGPPEMVMELAYRLAVSKQDHIEEIRDDVVLLITPTLEVDGRARMVDWWKRHLQGVQDLEDAPPRMAPYWGDYTAHDNNRDGLQISQALTRNYTDFYHRWHPVASLDLHESVPLMYVSTGTGPYNEAVDPITVTEWQMLSSYEVSEATKMGLPGVWTWGFYTGWYPGYLLWVTNNHNALGRFYETFGNSHPGTFDRDLRDSKFAGERTNARQWYRASPPDKDVRWSLRNNTNYMQTGVLASLQFVARHREQLLMNFWRKGHNALKAGATEAPFAFVIPAAQRDTGALHHLLDLLEHHRVEVHEASADARYGELDVHAGDYVVRMDQPYRNFARTLLMPQPFPKRAEHTPYDDVAWSLDLMLGVDVHPVDDAAVAKLPMASLDDLPPLPGEVVGAAPWRIEHHGQAHLAGVAYALAGAGANLRATAEAHDGIPAGTLVVDGIGKDALEDILRDSHVSATSAGAAMSAAAIEVDLPRVAVFHTWHYTQDSGWVRFTFEQLGIPYTLIDKDDLRSGALRGRFDVILVPSQGGMTFAEIIHGIDRKWAPLPYTQTDEFPSHGVIDSSPDITGGMGFQGMAELRRFLDGGGTVVTLGSGGHLAADGGLARGVSSASGRHPGSHVTVKTLRPEHPLSFGMEPVGHAFRGGLPLFTVREFDRGQVVMQWGTQTWAEAEKKRDEEADVAPGNAVAPQPSTEHPTPSSDTGALATPKEDPDTPPLVLSGRVPKPEMLARMPAVLDVPSGGGRVVLFAFNPLHRHQNWHDFAYVGNALLFWNDMPPPATKAQMRER